MYSSSAEDSYICNCCEFGCFISLPVNFNVKILTHLQCCSLLEEILPLLNKEQSKKKKGQSRKIKRKCYLITNLSRNPGTFPEGSQAA